MATKKKAVIELDIIAPGLEQIKKFASSTDESMGEFHTKSQKILKIAEKIEGIFAEYGDNIPISKVKELEKMYAHIGDLASDMEDMGGITIFDPKELARVKELTKKMVNLKSKINELENQKKENDKKAKERLNQLKSQRTAKNEKGETVDLKSLKDDKGKAKWKTAKDLQDIAADPSSTKEQVEAANAILYQYNQTLDKTSEANSKLQEKIDSLNGEYEEHSKEIDKITGSYRELTEEERSALQVMKTGSEETAKHLAKVSTEASKAGKTTVEALKSSEKATNSFGKAVKSVLSVGAMWNLTKKIINESIKTINEMDQALTGMTVVTGKSREEVNSLVPSIRNLSRTTGAAMTEIADTITEYVKQGRSLSDSYILAEETAKAAKIAGISLADSVTYLTSAVNGFNLAAKDATRVSDVFANLAAISATDYEDLAIALSKVSAQANLAGMSMEYTTALLAKGIETTQEAPESIGTALKTVIARMRELTDYGKTLEDGASVNRVEAALASAGIELRDINGEFKNLDSIFNELGPKWDSLNTMQQQAIAQAVAGTRQQSRFIAIMQDWERTEELATEAQDSAGASAAQHAKYMEGMEAAMNNLKSAWQGFIQSVVDSEIVIGFIRGVGDFVNFLATTVEKLDANKFTTVLVALVGVGAAVGKVKEKLTDQHEQELQNQRKVHEEEIKSLENEKRRLELIKQSIEAEAELSSIKALGKSREADGYKAEGDNYDVQASAVANAMMEMDGYGAEVDLEQLTLLEQKYDELIMKRDEAYAREAEAKNQAIALENQANEIRSRHTEIDKQIADTQNQINETEQSMGELQDSKTQGIINQNNAMIQQLKLQQQEIKNAKALLQAELARTKDIKKKQKLEKQINALDKTELKNKKRIKSLEDQNLELTKRSAGFFDSIRSSLTGTITSGLRSMLGTLGPIGDITGDILANVIEWGVQMITQRAVQKASLQNELKMNAYKSLGYTMDQARLLTQLNIEDSTEDELKAAAAILGIDADKVTVETLIVLLKNKQKEGEKQVTKEKKKGFWESVKNAIANIGQSAGLPFGASMAFAIAGAAVLATVGVGGLIGALSAASAKPAPSDAQLEKDITKKQQDTYELKNRNKELSSSVSEIDTLNNKKIKTAEDEEKLKELTKSLREQNEAWKNLPDDQVLQAAKNEMQKNTDQIKANVNSSYELALQMEDLTGAIAKQALSDKMIQDQNSMAVGAEGDIEKAKADAASMAKIYVDQNAEVLSKSLKSAEHTDGEIGWNKAQAWIGGIGGVLGVGSLINRGIDAGQAFAEGDVWGGIDEILTGGMIGEITDIWQDDSKNVWQKIGGSVGSWAKATAKNIPIVSSIVEAVEYGSQAADAEAENERAEREQQEAKKKIERYNRNIMDFASQMSEAGDSVYDQLLKYQELTDVYDDVIDDVAASQYSTLDVLNQAVEGSPEVAHNLELLGKAGLLGADSLLGIVDEINNVTTGQGNLIQQGLDLESEGFFVGDKNYSLNELRSTLGFKKGEKATLSDITAKYFETYGQKDEDGKITMKEGGSLDVYNKLVELSSSLGDYAKYTEEQLEVLKEFNLDLDPGAMVAGLIQDTMSQLNITTEEQAKNYRESEELQAQGARLIYENGMAMIESQLASTKQYIQEKEQELSKLREAYKNASTEEERQKLSEEITNITTALGPVQSEYTKALTQLTNATLKAAGLMDNATADNKYSSIDSTKERIADIIGKLGGEDPLTSEDYAYIRDDLAPMLQDYYESQGKTFDLAALYDGLQNGTDEVYKALTGTFSSFGDLIQIDFSRSISVIDGQIEDLLNNSENYNENGELTDLAKSNLNSLKFSKATQEAQKAAAAKIAVEGGRTLQDLQLDNARKIMEALDDSEESMITKYDKIRNASNVLINDIRTKLDDEYNRLVNTALKSEELTAEELKQYIKFVNGKMTIDEKWYSTLDVETKNLLNSSLESLEEYGEEYYDAINSLKEATMEYYESQIETQSQMIEAYKSKLEEEQEALQDSLDKRKEMYEKYFDSLEEQESDETFEEEQARLQRAIAALSSSSDATSLAKLKEYQEQLQELEDEQLQTERERRRDVTMTNLDNQSETLDQYYEDRLANEQKLWEDIGQLNEKEISDLMATYSEEYKNATDLNKQYMLLSYKELNADVLAMLGKTDAATQARKDAINYAKYLEAYAADKSIGAYDAEKTYSTGGIVDYTGLAMVHGTATHPEAFLNASQTAMFAQLSKNLEVFYSRSSGYNGSTEDNNSVVIENFTIAVDATLTDGNVQQTGESLADALLEGLRRTGVSVNMKR